MSKTTQTAEHVIVTFFEAVIAYVSVNQSNLSGNAKVVAIGAVGFGISAVYNLLRQSTPPLSSTPPVGTQPLSAQPVAPVVLGQNPPQ